MEICLYIVNAHETMYRMVNERKTKWTRAHSIGVSRWDRATLYLEQEWIKNKALSLTLARPRLTKNWSVYTAHSIFLNCYDSLVRKIIRCNISTFCTLCIYTVHSFTHTYIHTFLPPHSTYIFRKLLFKLDRVFVYIIIIHPYSSMPSIHWAHKCIGVQHSASGKQKW